MKFSLIICTYQRPKALINLLNSVQKQVLYPNEILIIDGSLDSKTTQILKVNHFENLQYFKVEENERGLTKQRNYGISRVANNCDIICFLDDDTILEKDYFGKLIATYDIHPDALAVGGYIVNEISWQQKKKENNNDFFYDGWVRKDSSRFILRKKIGLLDNTPPGWMPTFSNGRSVGFLPPNNKIYPTEMIMGGASSYKKEIFKKLQFSTYFEGYGLYEDADFSLRISKIGSLYINTSAQLEHHHHPAGRPNQFRYGKMVVRNGWYVWRIKYPKPSLEARFKWHLISFVLTLIRFSNVITTNKRKEALTESIGRVVGWFSLLISKPV